MPKLTVPFRLFEMLNERVPHLHILDVGAMQVGTGPTPYAQIAHPGRVTITGFEPLKEECERLNAGAAPGSRYLPHCVGDGSRHTFHITKAGYTSSLYPPNVPLLHAFNKLEEITAMDRTEEIQTVRLDDLPEITAAHYIKLDVQGANVDVLKGAERLLKSTLVVYSEVEFVEMYKGQPLFGDLDIFLRSHGFMFHCFDTMYGRPYTPVMMSTDPAKPVRQQLWADVVYVRDFTRFHELEPHQLIALAVMVQDLFGSVDLAQVALNHHDRKAGTTLWREFMTRLTGAKELDAAPPLAGLDEVPS